MKILYLDIDTSKEIQYTNQIKEFDAEVSIKFNESLTYEEFKQKCESLKF